MTEVSFRFLSFETHCEPNQGHFFTSYGRGSANSVLGGSRGAGARAELSRHQAGHSGIQGSQKGGGPGTREQLRFGALRPSGVKDCSQRTPPGESRNFGLAHIAKVDGRAESQEPPLNESPRCPLVHHRLTLWKPRQHWATGRCSWSQGSL